MIRQPAGRRGFSMVELIIAITVSSIVLIAAYGLLRNNQKFYRAQTEVTDVQTNLRSVSQILAAELREISSEGGDIIAMTDSSLEIRAMRGLGIVCDTATLVSSGFVDLKSSRWFGYRNPNWYTDGIVIFVDGDTQLASDDAWVQASINSTSAGTCTDGTASIGVNLTGVTGGLAALTTVTNGSPVRTFETVRYSLYTDGSGLKWLGISQYQGGFWTATNEVAGPLDASGLQFTFYDRSNTVTAVPANVTSVAITVRAASDQPISVQGRPTGIYHDSLTVLVSLRGN